MPDLNFTFGIGNYINFTFNLQLGIPPNLRKSASQEVSLSYVPNFPGLIILLSSADGNVFTRCN